MPRFLPTRNIGAAALALLVSATLPSSAGAQAARPRSRAPKSQQRAPERQTDLRTYLNAALRLYESLEYERALEQIRRARNYTRSVEDDVTVSLLEGIILADLGRREDAIAAFRTGLLLRPDAALPVKVSPKVERDFETVREGVRRELSTLQAKQESEQKPEEPGAAPPTPEPVLPQDSRPASEPAAAAPIQGVATPVAPRSKTLSYVLLGGGAVAVGAGTFLGLSALSYNDDRLGLRADEAVKARSQSETQLAAGAVLVPVGLAALGTGLVLLLSSGDAASPPSSTVSLAPLPGGLSLGAAGRF